MAGLEVPAHVREESSGVSGEAPACCLALNSVFFSYRLAVGLGAAALWCWVLHDGGPLGVVVSGPSAPLSDGISFQRFQYLQECRCG